MLPSLTLRTMTPFDAFDDMRRVMDRLFDGAVIPSGTAPWRVPADVVETDGELRFSMDIPGVKPEDINVTVEKDVLTVSGERSWSHEEKDGEYRRLERRYGRFQRSFVLPSQVDANRIAAQYENGVLTVVLPKLEEAKPRRIPINATNGGRQIEAASTN